MGKYKYAMIGYYPNHVCGQVYAVGNEGVESGEAKKIAREEGLEMYQLFPLPGEGGQHQLRRWSDEKGRYTQGQSREFAARLSGYVGKLIEEDKARREKE